MRVACGQFESAPGDIPHNIGRISGLAAEAARRGARLIVLPELCLSGYVSRSDAARLAVAVDGAEMSRLRDLARETGVAICFGFPERSSEGLFNSMAFLDRDGGKPVVYRKIHLWVSERGWAREGATLVSFPLEMMRAGMWVCYDSRFPEVARALAFHGVTLALVGSAWFGPDAEWDLAIRSRALDNGIFVAGAVTLGSFGGAPFRGRSIIVDPHGNLLASAREGEECLITAECDPEAVKSFRTRLPLLEDARPASCTVEDLP